MIFVAGATGNVGGQIVRILADAGDDVQTLVREGRQSALPPGAKPVVGELNLPETFSGALGRVDAAFLLSGYKHQEQTLHALRDAGAERIVLLSSSSVPGGELDNAVTRLEHTANPSLLDVHDPAGAEIDRGGSGGGRPDRFVETQGCGEHRLELGVAEEVLVVEGLFDHQEVELVHGPEHSGVEPGGPP